jgi:hypothetical protein
MCVLTHKAAWLSAGLAWLPGTDQPPIRLLPHNSHSSRARQLTLNTLCAFSESFTSPTREISFFIKDKKVKQKILN